MKWSINKISMKMQAYQKKKWVEFILVVVEISRALNAWGWFSVIVTDSLRLDSSATYIGSYQQQSANPKSCCQHNQSNIGSTINSPTCSATTRLSSSKLSSTMVNDTTWPMHVAYHWTCTQTKFQRDNKPTSNGILKTIQPI